MDGTKSHDPDGGSIASYSWTQTAGSTVTLTGANTAKPTFTAPKLTADTTLIFRLVVTDTDGGASSSPATTTVLIKKQVVTNQPPIANAGKDQTVSGGTVVKLDGSKSYDPDGGKIASYQWVQTAGTPTVTLSGAKTAIASFKAPIVNNKDTTLTFKLTVTDNDGGATSSATTNVLVKHTVNHCIDDDEEGGGGKGESASSTSQGAQSQSQAGGPEAEATSTSQGSQAQAHANHSDECDNNNNNNKAPSTATATPTKGTAIAIGPTNKTTGATSSPTGSKTTSAVSAPPMLPTTQKRLLQPMHHLLQLVQEQILSHIHYNHQHQFHHHQLYLRALFLLALIIKTIV